MNILLKRLDIIKNSIAIEEEDLIVMQLRELEKLSLDDSVQHIIELIKSQSYEDVIQLIERYKNANEGMVLFEDPKIQGLRLELKILEKELKDLTEQRNNCTNIIDDFNREYNLLLGAIIKKILGLRERILYQQLSVKYQIFQTKKEAFNKAEKEVDHVKKQIAELEKKLNKLDGLSYEYIDLHEKCQNFKEYLTRLEKDLDDKRHELNQIKQDLDHDPINEKYHEAKEDTFTFNKEYKEVISDDVYDLNEKQLIELKKAYREAARLCHPDILSEEMKLEGHRIMSELNIARKKRDLEKVKEILLSLQTGGQFRDASDTIKDIELLKATIINIRKKINSLKTEICDLEGSDTFKTIQDIDDKDEYFDGLQQKLEVEHKRLIDELNQITNNSSNSNVFDRSEQVDNSKINDDYRSENDTFEKILSCPKCNSEMVLRTAKSGKYSGKQFWGCGRYPNCYGIINI
jgi:hypothetical protein